MNLYQSLGYLVLGSRLRRLSESFLAEINRVYQNEGIDFDASWFPVFYLLSKNEALSIKELSEQIEVSHPAASQLITNLKNRGLVTSATCADDGRRQLVTLTQSGHDLLARILPVWDVISIVMADMVQHNEDAQQLLPAITALETAFRSTDLAGAISQKLVADLKPANHE